MIEGGPTLNRDGSINAIFQESPVLPAPTKLAFVLNPKYGLGHWRKLRTVNGWFGGELLIRL